MSETPARYATALGGAPRGGLSSWSPICTPDDCDAFVTIVAPLFDLDPASPWSMARAASLRDLLGAHGIHAAQVAPTPAAGDAVVSLATGVDPGALTGGVVAVRGLVVATVSQNMDVLALARADLDAGASASAWLLVDAADAVAPPLGTIVVHDRSVARVTIERERDGWHARCAAMIARDRIVARAEFAISSVHADALAIAAMSLNLEVLHGKPAVGLLPWRVRWCVFVDSRRQ